MQDGRAAIDDLVGRARELAVLDDAIRSAATGQRSVLLITGEPGIGKTRLLEALAVRLERMGGRAVWGRTWEVGLTPAFWPWTQVLAAMADPETDGPPIPELVGIDDRADAASRISRFDAVSMFLVTRASDRPLGILLDDMHAADPSSMLLLEYLARHVRSARLVIAIAARDGEASDEIEAALARIRRDAKRIVVGRLAAGDIARLVGDRATPALVQRLHELSAGNPLFVEELVACIEAHGSVDGIGQITGVGAVIRDRIARLPEAAVTTLAAAALAGREVRGAVIADALGIDAAELEARLAPAVRLGVITRGAPDRYRFSHGLIAETLAAWHGDAAQRLHARLANAIDRIEGDEGASAIAHHRLAIAHTSTDAAIAAAAAAERAARVALAQLAFEDAAGLLARAIDVLREAPATRKHRATLLCARAEALQHAGEHATARTLCDRAAELARDADDGVMLARIALARGIEFSFGTTDRALVELLQEALAAMPPGDSGLRARCLARLAAAEQPSPDSRAPIATAREAIAMARRIGDRRTRLDVLHVAFAALVEYVPPAELDVLLRELFVLATRPGDRLVALRNRLRHCFVTLGLADRKAFDAAITAHAELAESIGIPRWTWPVKLLAAMVATFEGRFGEAASLAGEAERFAAGDPQGDVTFAYHRLAAAWTATAPCTALAGAVAERFAYARPLMELVVAVEDGDPVAVAAALAAAEPTIANDDFNAVGAIDIIAARWDRERVRRLYDRLRPTAGRAWVASMTGFALHDLADRGLLVLAGALGDLDAVDRHGRAAVDLAEALDAIPFLARTRADWAAALDRLDGAGERTRADELWHLAAIDAERLGMQGLLARCRTARPVASSPPPRSSTPSVPPRERVPTIEAVSVIREGELWIVRGRGGLARIRDSRGVQMLARLVAEPGRELHALDLVSDGGIGSFGAAGAIDPGDAGELLDARAKAAYRKRLAELTEELEEAEAWRDPVRTERARVELDALTRELERAVGLGGRDRKAGAAGERARTNAQRRLAYAILQVKKTAPALGEHLARSIRTGTFCVYEPH